ncbi:MAG: preprotein translocase subunit SecE [Clostridiales bacterium]|jgi:preprotein translocase subunit SecE|nr:preprotein translocase subunit SecE [Clostridiales bacterium]
MADDNEFAGKEPENGAAAENGAKSERPARKDVRDKGERRGSIAWVRNTFGIYRGEFKKITWPTWEDLAKETFTVIVTSLMIGAIIAGMDYIFEFGYRAMVGFFLGA